MKHLIIGAGNMGRRHGNILVSMGDTVDYVDLGYKPGNLDGYDSVLICTPPKTHQDLILAVSDSRSTIPLFVEKPLSCEPWGPQYEGLTSVACNWRWCWCIGDEPINIMRLWYKADPETAYLDLIHFVDLFWEARGEPETGSCTQNEGVLKLTMQRGGALFDVTLDPRVADNPTTMITHKPGPFYERVHADGPCRMFERQMKAWRELVMGERLPWNSFKKAAERTNWLIARKPAPAGLQKSDAASP